MRVVFLTHDLQVKHFHMANAIRNQLGIEPHLLHLLSSSPNPVHVISKFPKIGAMWTALQENRARFVKDKGVDQTFGSISQYSVKRLERLKPSVIYVNNPAGVSAAKKAALPSSTRLVYDIEDLALADLDFVDDARFLKAEQSGASHSSVDYVLFGSKGEMKIAEKHYDWLANKPHRVQYPFVAKGTLPRNPVHKIEDFSMVYAGSIWTGGGYRNITPILQLIASQGIRLDVFLLNDWTRSTIIKLTALMKEYPNLRVRKRLPLPFVKIGLMRYHTGLCLSGGYTKLGMTFGMKPIEYAYANVVPVSVANDISHTVPLRNLSDGKEFGYTATPDTIASKYHNALKSFDTDFHLMDNHVNEFKELEF